MDAADSCKPVTMQLWCTESTATTKCHIQRLYCTRREKDYISAPQQSVDTPEARRATAQRNLHRMVLDVNQFGITVTSSNAVHSEILFTLLSD